MKNNWGSFVVIVFVIAMLALSFGIIYWIAESNLPDWVKFLLLK